MQTEIAEPSGGAWQASKSHTHSLVLLQSLRGASDGQAGRQHVGRRFALGHGKGRPLARALDDVAAAARGTQNVLVPMKEALRAMATLGEVADTLRGVYGVYQPGG